MLANTQPQQIFWLGWRFNLLMKRTFLFTCLSFAISLTHADDNEAGHSKHGEAFNEGPRQAAVLMPGTGKVNFIITTKNSEAQKFFNQGLGQQHGFWYYEAERSFRQASALDPAAAMPFWGMAMANVNNEKRAKQFINRAVEKKASASQREQKWIGILEKFYSEAKDDKRDKKQRDLDYIKGLEDIVDEFPKDVEAKAFLAWKLWAARDSVGMPSLEAVNALMDQVFALEPMHPTHHYRIHLWDQSKPKRALGSAALCGQVADGIAHMWHMPGHTFSKLNRFDDAVWQQEASTRVDHAYMMRSLVLPDQIHNYAHNEEWLIRNYNELGRAKDAIALGKSLIANPRHPSHNTLDKASTSASWGRTRLIESLVKWELWDELKKLTDSVILAPTVQAGHELTRQRGLAVAAYHQGKLEVLKASLSAIEKLKDEAPKVDDKKKKDPPKEEIRKGLPAKPDAEAKAKPEKKKEPTEREKSLQWLRVLTKVLAKEKKDAVAPELEKAKDLMPKDLLADCWLKLGDKTKAAEAIGKLPQDLWGSARQAELYLAAGKEPEAKKAMEKVAEKAFAMDKDLPLRHRLDALAPKLGLPANWVKPAPVRNDVGVRPSLASLGPIHWSPPVAPAWEGLNAEGKTVGNKDFSGKPVVLVFYIGSGCAHCMEQLVGLEKDYAEFTKRGLPVVAVSPEPVALVGRAQKYAKTKGGFPFPMLASKDQSIFRAYRAWDDFEDFALHAVAIVDGQQRLRWLDVSYEPFMNLKFVAEEAERLLKQ